jgi:hypothetical protein
MMLKGIEERRREIAAEDKRLVDILRRHGRTGTAKVALLSTDATAGAGRR